MRFNKGCSNQLKFSISHLLGFVVCVSIAFALSQLPAHISMLAILTLVIVPMFFLLDIQQWRQLTYGGLAGILAVWLFNLAVTHLLHMHLPRPPIRSRYDTGLPQQQIEFADRTRPFVVPVGFLLGATGTLIYSANNRARTLKTLATETKSCSHCQRILAASTIVCPRCEQRVDA